MVKFYEIPSLSKSLFGEEIELLPSVTELFEFELAYFEYKSLPRKDYLERTAYGKSINQNYSLHYSLYSQNTDALTEERSSLTNSYFKAGQFATGYATHSLFPYRGKFHPQLIKGLLNILGIKKGDIILDPMTGSGTTNIEAALLGIDSFAIDVSPFCQLMTKVKYEALTIDLQILNNSSLDSEKLFYYFSKKNVLERIETIKDFEKVKIYNLAFLAFLDSMGYAKRVKTSKHEQLFRKVLNRYVETVKTFLNNQNFNQKSIGKLKVLSDSDALNMKIADNSIDCLITSPPYSFAIDYIENDSDQLKFLGYDTKELRNRLIGLKGKTKKEKLYNYFSDMDTFCSEASRVLKENKFFVLIIGSNTNQTGGIRLEQTIINSAKKHNLALVKSILKPIKGMRNTMKEEYILIFEKAL